MFYVMFRGILLYFFFFFNDTATTEIYTLSLHDALPICIDSLRYFWSERTPKGFATDLQKIIDHYRQQWHRDKVMLIGFSQGADVLPATINQLDAGTRDALDRIVLLDRKSVV